LFSSLFARNYNVRSLANGAMLSKLVFLRSRYYSPETARFLSKDVWQGDYTRPQSLNGWGYVEGNPINFNDPTGWCRDDPFGDTTNGDRCSEEIDRLERKYQLIIKAGYSPYACWIYGIDDLKPGTPIPWTMDELTFLDQALELTKAFLDRTVHPFNGSLGGKNYTIKRVHVTVTGPMDTNSYPPVTTAIPDEVFARSPNGEGQHSSLMTEFFHAFDFQQNPWVSANRIFADLTRDPGSTYCGSTYYACTNRYEMFSDNATAYALDWLSHKDAQLAGDANLALARFPNPPVHRVELWKDGVIKGVRSTRLLFFNWYFFGFETDNWLKGGH
jgi:RHS repeat-associated protein